MGDERQMISLSAREHVVGSVTADEPSIQTQVRGLCRDRGLNDWESVNLARGSTTVFSWQTAKFCTAMTTARVTRPC